MDGVERRERGGEWRRRGGNGKGSRVSSSPSGHELTGHSNDLINMGGVTSTGFPQGSAPRGKEVRDKNINVHQDGFHDYQRLLLLFIYVFFPPDT
ncbi:hypothetical protein E2C01_078749 [Portunus trituberculatus]|uniref:Uncharacterized protein n=1 Tax=Portunus trituberculatus TaxID=210409 RepID=A0A5B7INK7_PORTR|nr:hypothetical protein [Portunus trituberculatus]